MSAFDSFAFSGYTLRPASEADLPLARLWTLADTAHSEIIKPSFWLEQRPGRDAYVVHDGRGPVFFLKLHLCADPLPDRSCDKMLYHRRVELYVQFMPILGEEDRERTRNGLVHCMSFTEDAMRRSGISEMFFESESPALIGFSKKQLGFKQSGRRLSKHL